MAFSIPDMFSDLPAMNSGGGLLGATASIGPRADASANLVQQYGLDPKRFKMNADGSVGIVKPQGFQDRPTDLKIPPQYFTSGMFQKDMQQYGQIMGPGNVFSGANGTIDPQFSFNPDGTPNTGYQGYDATTGQQINAGANAGGFDPSQYTQNDQGQVIGNAPQVDATQQLQWQAYQNLLNGTGGTTDFRNGAVPQALGSDVIGALASGGGKWLNPGTDLNKQESPIQADLLPDGRIVVTDLNHGILHYYDAKGNFLGNEKAAADFGPLKGLAMVGASAVGMGALGAAMAGGAAGSAAGAGAAGAGAGAGAAGAGMAGADMAAGAGLGSGAAGASFGGIGAGAAGSGFGLGTLGELGIGGASTFGSAGVGGLAGAGAALGAAGAGGATSTLGGSAGGFGGTPASLDAPTSFGGGSTSSLTGGFDGPLPAGSGFAGANTALPELGVGATPFGSSALGLDGAAGVLGAAGAAGSSGGLLGNLSGKDLLGLGSAAAGALGGAQGTKTTNTSSAQLPEFLKGPVEQDLIPRTQGLLNTQMPAAQQAGQQLTTAGAGLLGAPIAGNGVGQVKLNAPTTATNPYLAGMADDMQRRTQQLLQQNNLDIQGNAVGVGGLGGSRQGVAQGIGAGRAADTLQGQLAGLYGQSYNNDQNRALQQYGQDQSFYGQQRGQDLTGASIGAGMLSQGVSMPFAPLKDAANIYQPFTGFGTTTGIQSAGGGALGALGGALGGAQLANNLGLFGNSSGSGSSPFSSIASWWGGS